MTSGTLAYAVADGVATITLNRPQVMNALNADMIMRLREACEKARDDQAVRVVVLREMPKPVLASVHGAVAGAGVSLLAAADLAIAAADTKFTLAYIKIAT